ncbi:cytochrome P450 4C1-like isoform X2 [Anthonomus grandis grandis]|uniref:cytochrome P450 4C1-like isoform X2 n=1 Tax=Anthonomus grandis grandis TaxID=2921223 RepID=UPI0021663821|nr:cytochrome P450 4C1-like isoform X2 [Anthonomus grandis grandis]
MWVTLILVNLLLLALLIYCIPFIWRRRNWFIAARKFDGPVAFPIIGNAWLFMCKNEEVLMRIHNVIQKYDQKPIRFWLGPTLLVAIKNPEHVDKILTSSKFATKHDIYDFIKIYLGEGLISGSGSLYKQHRRIIQPIFDLNFAKESVTFIQKHVTLCMSKFENHVHNGTFDCHSVIHKCMVDIIKEIVLGSDERSQISGLSEFDQAMLDVYNFGFSRIVKPYLQPNVIFNLTPYKKEQDRLQSILKTAIKRMVEESNRRRKIQKLNDFYPVIDRIADYIQDNPGVISEEVFMDHILTLHAAAEDTLTIISCFLSICFGMYPEYQEIAANEVRKIMGDSPRAVAPEDISQLKYLDMCIKEALRLFPIAPVILRKCSEDFQLDKWLIPNDCAIAVPIFSIHRDERYWEHPDHFYPDHFLPEVVNKRHVYAYIPFSAGPRGCIGKILANTGLKVFICNLLQRFEIEADGKLPDLELKMDISTRPKRGYFLRLKKRVL